jgi:hypothetical protein
MNRHPRHVTVTQSSSPPFAAPSRFCTTLLTLPGKNRTATVAFLTGEEPIPPSKTRPTAPLIRKALS